MAPTPAPRVASQAPCFLIARLHADGIPQELGFLQSDLNRHARTCIGVSEINAISAELTADLIAHGYVTTRVRVPQQNLASGDLHYEITPGVIHAIAFARPHSQTTWQDAYPTRPGKLLNIRDLEQGLEQMKRVPSQDVQMAIAPDTHPGESNIMLDVKHNKPWRFVTDINDAGSAQTGPLQGSLTAALDNPFHANDLFNIALNSAVQGGIGGNTLGDSAYYSIPHGYWTFQFGATRFNYSQTISGLNSPYTLSGVTHQTSFGATRMLYRTQRVKTDLTVNLVNSTGRSFLDDTEIGVQQRDETYGEVVLSRSAGDGRSSLQTSIGLRLGLPILGALPDIQSLANPPTNFYTLETADISSSLPVRGTRLRWESHLHGQMTGDVLYPNDQFAIGNRYTVRGISPSASLAAESGYFWRNDIESALNQNTTVYFGLDTGAVWGQNTQFLSGTSLAGFAVGLRGNRGRISYDIFSGVPLHAPPGPQAGDSSGGVDVQVQI